MRIALVNDVALATEALRRVVVAIPDAEIAWIAEDGQQAVQKCQADRPDLILMDLIMPVLDGVEATRQIMQQCPCPILVVTATVTGNCSKVFEALGHGALDAVNTPVLGRDAKLTGGDELARKIRDVARLRGGRAPGLAASLSSPAAGSTRASGAKAPLVAIGASTGGPQALATVLKDLGQPIPCAVVIVQHLDPLFVPGLADWLARETNLSVRPIVSGQHPLAGTVYLACTPDHLIIDGSGQLIYTRQPIDHIYRPSVDVFFQSLQQTGVNRGLAVLLTGMGRDGAQGLKSLRDAGWVTMAQDQASSIVWGMPGTAVKIGAAETVLPLDEIGGAITRAISDKLES